MKHAKRQTAMLLLSLLCFVSVPARAADEPAAADGPPKLAAEFDIPKDGSLIVLPVTFKGKAYNFLVDTGSRYTTFDKAFAPLLGEPKGTLEGKTADGKEMTIHICYAPNATVGPLNLKQGGPVMCVDLTELRRLSGMNVQGVIGMGLLRRFTLQFDFDAGKLRCFQPDSIKREVWGDIVAMRTAGGTPVIRANVAGKFGTFFGIHTGYDYSGTLGRRFFMSLQTAGVIQKTARSLVGSTVDESEGSVSARIDDFRVGEFALNGLVFDKSPQEGSILGMSFLKRFNATFDFRNSRLYLTKSHLFDAPDQQDMSGLHLVQVKTGAKVHAVDPDSPASRAGIQADDIILKLNGRWVVKMTLAEARRLLRSGDGQVVKVLFQRGEQGYETSVTLKKQI
ncbi:MAG: PDZ domain-containing protein [Planctomycetes bacterium]|jgi:predicted aspartyl protease|nr:PDZ domain-containing protein [Planctomycetota bacterium]